MQDPQTNANFFLKKSANYYILKIISQRFKHD